LKLVEKSVSVLARTTRFSSRLAAAMEAYTGARDQIEHFVEKADVIEEF